MTIINTQIKGGGETVTPLNVAPSTSAQTITPPTGVGYGPVNVSAVTAGIDANIQAGNIKNGVSILGVTGTYSGGSSDPWTLGTVITDDDYDGSTNTKAAMVYGYFNADDGHRYALLVELNTYQTLPSTTLLRIYGAPFSVIDVSTAGITTYNGNVLIWQDRESASSRCEKIRNYLLLDSSRTGSVLDAYERTLTVNNVVYHGLLPSVTQLVTMYNNSYDVEANTYSWWQNGTLQNMAAHIQLLSLTTTLRNNTAFWGCPGTISNTNAIQSIAISSSGLSSIVIFEIQVS